MPNRKKIRVVVERTEPKPSALSRVLSAPADTKTASSSSSNSVSSGSDDELSSGDEAATPRKTGTTASDDGTGECVGATRALVPTSLVALAVVGR